MGCFGALSPGANSSVINAAPSIPTELGSTSAFDEIWQTPLETTVELPNPIWANAKSINFDKYYPTDIFSDIGFTPYADMDKVYNQNETSGDFLTRFTPNFFSLFRSGRFANYRSLSDLFDGEGYTTAPDLEGAVTMEEAMRLGGSTTGSVGGFFANTALNWAYSAGIVYQIAVEEVIAAGLAAAGAAPTGGGSLAAFGALTLKNLATLTRIPKTIVPAIRCFKPSLTLTLFRHDR